RQLCDLAETARTAVERVRPLASERGIAIECSLTRAEANADPESIGQVAMNLLSNAIRFNRQHGAIRVRSGAESGAAFLSVADTGIGVAEADLEHIFDRFYRGDRARTHASGGTGLGLAISRAIVAAHGGSIAVSSRAGDGSEFVVRLPSATCGVDGRGRGSLSRMPRTPQSAMNDQGDHCTSLG
ncbi:MAG TPA: HAMP domain-containing sensor histidine kinase, partial [Candidatus Paceibacterota bacterium]|nr:HAMP domain-containing sensor histidine kinase [Candidatus Paceibacterota bacterium]